MKVSLSTSSGTDEPIDPETHASSFAPAPVIDMPHRWDKSGIVLPETSPSPCPTCDWNGDPESFWDHKRNVELIGEDFMQGSINCASCELVRCILFKRAAIEGRLVTRKSSVAGPGFHVGTQFDDEFEDVYHSIFVSSETPRSEIDLYNIPRRFISSDDSLNQESSKWARERLAACESSHDLCKSQSGGSLLPTRLINLQPGWKGLDVRLENPALPACITTAETLVENQTRIAWDKLPATFQDAAAFTQSLGIRYLWIDSVCIIQEDEDDWQQEAGKMYAVYKNSYLTLAALSGSASTTGLRNTSIKQDSHLVAELRIAQNVYPLYMRRAHYLDSLGKPNVMDYFKRKALAHRYPLLGRAWAYQERTISPRVIFFTESEMIFQCLEHVECECGSAQEWCQTKPVHRTNKTSIFMQTESDSLKLKGKDLASECFRCDFHTEDGRDWGIARDWRASVVREYSALETSMSRDRLPALGAIAEQFKRVRTEEAYLAGLWSRSLLDDLLWLCSQADASSKKSKTKLERPFSLPTWSWASLQCNVGYYRADTSVPMAETIEANCSYVEGNEFGVLESSKLVLRGRILISVVKWDHNGSSDCSLCLRDGNGWAEFVDDTWSNLIISMDTDQDGDQRVPLWQEISILEISESTRYENDSSSTDWNFLLLRREVQDGVGYYTRAGVAKFLERNAVIPYPGCEERQGGFERIFEVQSVWTTCEIR